MPKKPKNSHLVTFNVRNDFEKIRLQMVIDKIKKDLYNLYNVDYYFASELEIICEPYINYRFYGSDESSVDMDEWYNSTLFSISSSYEDVVCNPHKINFETIKYNKLLNLTTDEIEQLRMLNKLIEKEENQNEI